MHCAREPGEEKWGKCCPMQISFFEGTYRMASNGLILTPLPCAAEWLVPISTHVGLTFQRQRRTTRSCMVLNFEKRCKGEAQGALGEIGIVGRG